MDGSRHQIETRDPRGETGSGDDDRCGAAAFVPATLDLQELRDAAQSCRGCSLYRGARQTVFGVDPPSARVVLIGEQPDLADDHSGRPFSGAAGSLLESALAEAGLDRCDVYLTHAVKHIKLAGPETNAPQLQPTEAEIQACRPWLAAELAAVQPGIVVCLGVTAARALFGMHVHLVRGQSVAFNLPGVTAIFATDDPETILHLPTRSDQTERFAGLVADLYQVAELLKSEQSLCETIW